MVSIFLEEYDKDLTKIREYICDTGSNLCIWKSVPERLQKRYGDSLFVAEGKGVESSVTFMGTSCKILRDC